MAYIINFGHALAPAVLAELVPGREVRIPISLDLDGAATPPQVRRIVDRAAQAVRAEGGALDGTVPIVVVLPGLTEGAALLLAELHGRLGHFPCILALRRRQDGTYGLARGEGMFGGILDLEKVRQAARDVGRHGGEVFRGGEAGRRDRERR